MFGRYLRRELLGRRRQTVIVAVGMALAIALVVVVNSVSTGMRDAQAAALQSIYGVGTDITVSNPPVRPSEGGAGGAGPQRFDFGSGGSGGGSGGTGSTDGSTTVSQSRLIPAGATFDASELKTIEGVSGVAAATGVLSLRNVSFNGQIPDGAQPEQGAPGSGGARGSFDVDSFTVLGIDPSGTAVGPLSSVEVTEGRALDAADSGQDVALLDASYATTAGLSVGGTVEVGGTTMQVVGLLGSTSTSSETAANVYLPLDVAQTLAGQSGKLSEVYVAAQSSAQVDAVASAITAALPDARVSTEAQLAASVSGSLGAAAGLMSSLGLWLSIGVLAAAVLLAALFTISGVSRRTREFGTLKAIGWANRRIVGQVAAESLVQSLIGGIAGAIIGIAAVLLVNASGVTLAAQAAGGTLGGAGAGPFGRSGGGAVDGGGRVVQAAASATDIVLHAPVSVWVVLLAIALAAAGGIVAGALGGWRASRLRPADALREIA